MPLVINGRLDGALLANVPGGRLDLAAAASWIRLRADVLARFGFDLMPTSSVDTYRPYEVQERIFRQRYTTERVTGIDPRQWLGMTWWRLPVYAAAAVPGTSNHGWGRAVDIASMGGFTSAKYKAVSAVAPAHGWDNNEGRSINEPWHWTYKPANDSRPGGSTPAPEIPLPEDDMAVTIARLKPQYNDPRIWRGDGIRRTYIGSLVTLANLQAMIRAGVIKGDDEIHEVDELDWLGAVDAAPAAGGIDYAALAKAVNDDAARRMSA